MSFEELYFKCFNAMTDSIINHRKELERLEKLQIELEESYLRITDSPEKEEPIRLKDAE